MARDFFKNLPNTTTPITAPRLNGLLDGDEAMGNIVVDSIKSKNTANPYNMKFANITYNYTTKIYTATDGDTASSLYLKVQQWTTTSSSSFIDGTNIIKQVNSTGIVSFTGTIANNSHYIRIGNNGTTNEFSIIIPLNNNFNVGDTFTISFNIIDNTIGAIKLKEIQLEKGSIASDYSPNQELNIDYGYGEFTPIIFGGTTAGTATYNLQEGHYCKVGKIVHFEIRIGCTLTGSSGLLLIGGFPNLGSYYEPSAMNVVSTLNGIIGEPLCTRTYGNSLLLDTYGINPLNNQNWNSTNYIYVSGTMLLE